MAANTSTTGSGNGLGERYTAPHHYTYSAIQPRDVIRAWAPSWVENVHSTAPAFLGPAIAYLCRVGRKGTVVKDLRKAAQEILICAEIIEDDERKRENNNEQV